jgi:hypothetical protein
MASTAQPKVVDPKDDAAGPTYVGTQDHDAKGSLDPLIRALGLAVARSAETRHRERTSARHG